MDEPQELPVPQIPLHLAVLCMNEDCEVVYQSAGPGNCPRCGGRNGLALSRVIQPLWGSV